MEADGATMKDPDLDRTVDMLGGSRTLRRPIQSRFDAHDLLRSGLPSQALHHLVRHVGSLAKTGGIEKAVGMSLRTLQRSKESPGKPLSPEQSGRTWKFAEVLARATTLFGSQPDAEQWLNCPAMALDDRKPIDLLSTPAGVESVETHLTRLEYGVYT